MVGFAGRILASRGPALGAARRLLCTSSLATTARGSAFLGATRRLLCTAKAATPAPPASATASAAAAKTTTGAKTAATATTATAAAAAAGRGGRGLGALGANSTSALFLQGWALSTGISVGGAALYLFCDVPSAFDLGFAGSVGVLGTYFAARGRGTVPRRGLVAGLACSWAAYHLVDFDAQTGRPSLTANRYVNLPVEEFKRRWGDSHHLNFLKLHLLATPALCTITWPMLLACQTRRGFGRLDLVGVSVCLAGLAVEALSDKQLRDHTSDPKRAKNVCQTGLWDYSRHREYLVFVGVVYLMSTGCCFDALLCCG